MKPIRRIILLNQMAGPLFRQLAEDIARCYPDGGLLVTGHQDTLAKAQSTHQRLIVVAAASYDRRSRFHRVFSWLRYLVTVTRFALFRKAGDVILLASNPPLLGPWVWLITRIRPTPYSVLVYDIYPEVLIRLGVLKTSGIVAALWRNVNKKVYRSANSVITIGHRMAGVILAECGLDRTEVSVQPPWVDVDKIQPIRREANTIADQFSPNDRIVVLYSGNMGASHDIDSMLEAVRLLKNDNRVHFVFIGEGEKREAVDQFIALHGLTNAQVYPFQAEELLPFTMAMGDISLVALDEGMEDLMVPSKVFSYLAAGSAILAIANPGSELSDILDMGECGVLVPPGNPGILKNAILELVEDPDRLKHCKLQSRQLAEKKFSRTESIDNFAMHLVQVGMMPTPDAQSESNV